MKLSIKSHSIRFRISEDEMSELALRGKLECQTTVPNNSGKVAVFSYGVVHSPDAAVSDLALTSSGMELVLNAVDFGELLSTAGEGVYIRRDYAGENEQKIRFVAYVEKDKKSKKYKKHETHEPERSVSTDSDAPLRENPEVNKL